MTALAFGVCGYWSAADEPPQPQQHYQKSEIEAIVVKVAEDNDLPPTTEEEDEEEKEEEEEPAVKELNEGQALNVKSKRDAAKAKEAAQEEREKQRAAHEQRLGSLTNWAKGTAPVRLVFAAMPQMANLDMGSDLVTILFGYIFGRWWNDEPIWWKSAFALYIAVLLSWRFNMLLAVLHPRPTRETMFEIYFPGMLLFKFVKLMAQPDETPKDAEANRQPAPQGGTHGQASETSFGSTPGEATRDEGSTLYTEETKAKRVELLEWIEIEHSRFRKSSNFCFCFKVMVLVRFELKLLALANYYGPFFVWRASLSLTRDAWADDGTKTKDEKSDAVKNNQLNATVLGAAEALFESLPQLILQSYFFYVDYDKQTRSDIIIFGFSAFCCVSGILHAPCNVCSQYDEMMKHMRPPKIDDEDVAADVADATPPPLEERDVERPPPPPPPLQHHPRPDLHRDRTRDGFVEHQSTHG